MQDLKVRGVRGIGFTSRWGEHFEFFKISCNSVESTGSIESIANYEKTLICMVIILSGYFLFDAYL